MKARSLPQYLEESARSWPAKPAVVDPAGWSMTYAELDRQSDALARFLNASGVRKGDRVGLVLPKSVISVVTLFGIMKAGAAYVPIDFGAPVDRGQRILRDCQVRAVVVDSRSVAIVPEDLERPLAAVIVVGPIADGSTRPTTAIPWEDALAAGGPEVEETAGPDDLAYILYTSGSTGMPKGVMLTHANATHFVDWCSSVFEPRTEDRFSSHAPFHFDLSVLDLYVSLKHGATLYLISDALGKNPKDLAKFIAENQLTIWYSTPSILTLLYQYGNLKALPIDSLRIVLFAGEVFPVKHLRAVKECWPAPVYYNLYGPTETNVCTFARIPAVVPPERETPYPIGFPCSHYRDLVLDADRQDVAAGEEGLLYMSGPSVFGGYWNRPVENAAAFLERDGLRWYNTGDVVRWEKDNGYVYVGRKDRMVKRRGYRIELGEIERALYLHPAVREAAVVAVPDQDAGVRILAYLSCGEAQTPSIVDLKTFCATKVPPYMSPDRFLFEPALPKTSTDKVDYQSLLRKALS